MQAYFQRNFGDNEALHEVGIELAKNVENFQLQSPMIPLIVNGNVTSYGQQLCPSFCTQMRSKCLNVILYVLGSMQLLNINNDVKKSDSLNRYLYILQDTPFMGIVWPQQTKKKVLKRTDALHINGEENVTIFNMFRDSGCFLVFDEYVNLQ